jgi:SAM-dependent methyltransferase
MKKNDLQEAFGMIDIYLFDQLLKGRFDDCHSVLDIGCGSGRNLVYFLKNGYQVYGIDQDRDSVAQVIALAGNTVPGYPVKNFCVAPAEEIPFEAASFDIAISSAVFHFARNQTHFDQMIREAWRVLKPGGFLFARMASDIGIEGMVTSLGHGRYRLPDGSDRFLVNEKILLYYTEQLNGILYENIKTTHVQNLRCMTTWCVRKKG